MIALALGACHCSDPQRPAGDGSRPVTPPVLHSGVETGHSATPAEWTWIDNGYGYSCGLLTDHRLVCWGSAPWAPVDVLEDIAQFDLGARAGCALDLDGRVTCWCGDPYREAACRGVPARAGFIQIRLNDNLACAEDAEHRLTCWGLGGLVRDVPEVPVEHWDVELLGGCALVQGEITCWGGQLDDLWATSPDAVPLPPEGGGFLEVTLGREHGCALGKDLEVQCWGSAGEFREGENGEAVMHPFPEAPPGPFVHLETYNLITCGFRPDDRVECWYSHEGVLGQWSWPEEERFAQLGLGEWDACGLTVDGRAICFPELYESYGEQQVPDLGDL